MYKILANSQFLGFCTLLFICLIVISVVNVNYYKLKIKKFNIYFVYTILIIAIGILTYLILFALKELGKYDNIQFYLSTWLYIIEFLPYILLVLIIYCVKNIYGYKKGKENINARFAISILTIATILVVYYLPHRNIINFNIDKVSISTHNGGGGGRSIDSKEDAERLLETINIPLLEPQ